MSFLARIKGPVVHGEADAAPPAGRGRRLLGAGAALLAGLALTGAVVSAYIDDARHQKRAEAVLRAAAMRARLESALASTVYLAQGLVAYVKGVEPLRPAGVEQALRAVAQADRRIRNVGLAPGNVLTYIYPLQGNEAALHLDYRTLPKQWPGVQRAMELRGSVLAGPVDLVQGGRGIICRTPVFLDDGRYWGVISIVISLDALIDDVDLADSADGMRYFLQGDNTDSPAILGSPRLLRADPVTMRLQVPGGTWTLAAVPVDGWAVPRLFVALLGLGGAALSLMFAGFVHVLLLGRAAAAAHNQRLRALNAQLSRANGRLAEITRRDELTGIANRRCFDEALDKAWARCRRQHLPLSVLMIDIDHFKSINDSHGHAAGDACLVETARRLAACLRRPDDMLARCGGEEFALLCPGTHHAGAMELAETLRATMAAAPLHGDNGAPIPLSISLGVATVVPGATTSARELLSAADEALYQAKRDGRNCVRSAGEQRGSVPACVD